MERLVDGAPEGLSSHPALWAQGGWNTFSVLEIGPTTLTAQDCGRGKCRPLSPTARPVLGKASPHQDQVDLDRGQGFHGMATLPR